MGSNFARDLAELSSAGPSDPCLDIDQAVLIHLTSNHYPPVPRSMVKPALTAITLANEGDYEALVALPEGITWKGADEAPASALINDLHLEYFLSL